MEQQGQREDIAQAWLNQTEALLRATLEQQFQRCPELMNWADRNLASDKIDDLIADLHCVVLGAERQDRMAAYA